MLADDFYLLAHDDLSGRARLPERVTGLGTAGALLAELVHDGFAVVADGVVALTSSRPPSGEELTTAVYKRIEGEPGHPVRTWLAFLARSAEIEVARRLTAAGVLVHRASHRPRHPGRWLPADPNAAALPGARLVTRLIRGEQLDDESLVLVGLLHATGLDATALWEVRDAAPEILREPGVLLAALPESLRELISHTEAAVGSAIAAHRA